MYIYCLFCETAKCRNIAGRVGEMFGCCAISPRQVQHTWSHGQMVDIEHDLLPGYVFVYMEDAMPDLHRIRTVDGVIRCLCDADRQYQLTGSDEQFALMLLDKGGVIGKTKVYQEGQMIRLKEGAFGGVEARILKVNRRNMRMQIELPFASLAVRTWVEYEMVEDAGK